MGINNPSVSYNERTFVLHNNSSGNGNGTVKNLTSQTMEMLIRVVGSGPILVVNLEMSRDNVSWVPAVVDNILTAGVNLVNTITNPNGESVYRWLYRPGYRFFRARISGYLSGSVTITGIERVST